MNCVYCNTPLVYDGGFFGSRCHIVDGNYLHWKIDKMERIRILNREKNTNIIFIFSQSSLTIRDEINYKILLTKDFDMLLDDQFKLKLFKQYREMLVFI